MPDDFKLIEAEFTPEKGAVTVLKHGQRIMITNRTFHEVWIHPTLGITRERPEGAYASGPTTARRLGSGVTIAVDNPTGDLEF